MHPWDSTCSWHISHGSFHIAPSLRTILIKHPISIWLCKSEQASTLISHRLYPDRASATLEIRKPISWPRCFTGLKWFLVVTLLSGCFHLGICPSGEFNRFSCSFLFSTKGIILSLSTTTIDAWAVLFDQLYVVLFLLCLKTSLHGAKYWCIRFWNMCFHLCSRLLLHGIQRHKPPPISRDNELFVFDGKYQRKTILIHFLCI